ncbi:MAG TPA: patatin-like phospholipase family protein [Gemmatimonadaceae bacterium]|nr:patatin-like phospholipase family protein [Gemmatimonadaceae bacterium]
MPTNTRDLALTFAGGGNRSFYQLGLLDRWQHTLLPRTAAIASCSAGACVITTFLSGRRAEAREYWLSRARGITRNFDWSRLVRGGRVAPQGEIYRDTLFETFAGGGFERIRSQPFPIYVLASRFPWLLPRTLSVALGISVYSLERAMRRAPHPISPRLLGFRAVAIDARSCESVDELVHLILASSATPPFTPIGTFRGQRLLDGGMVDNAPAFMVEERHPELPHSIVFMSRPYHPAVMGIQGRRLYLAPTIPTPIGRWDYTRPHLLDATIAMGEREAEIHRPLVDAYLAREVAPRIITR